VPPVTHTHALFAEQSQSILDDLMEIIGPELSMQWFSRGCAVGGGLPIIGGRKVEVVRVAPEHVIAKPENHPCPVRRPQRALLKDFLRKRKAHLKVFLFALG